MFFYGTTKLYSLFAVIASEFASVIGFVAVIPVALCVNKEPDVAPLDRLNDPTYNVPAELSKSEIKPGLLLLVAAAAVNGIETVYVPVPNVVVVPAWILSFTEQFLPRIMYEPTDVPLPMAG